MKNTIVIYAFALLGIFSCSSSKQIVKVKNNEKIELKITNINYSNNPFKLIAECEIANNSSELIVFPKPHRSNNKSMQFYDNYFKLELNDEFNCDLAFIDALMNDREIEDFYKIEPGDKAQFKLDYVYSNGQDCYNNKNSKVEVTLIYGTGYNNANRQDFLNTIIPNDILEIEQSKLQKGMVLDSLQSNLYVRE